MTIRSLSLALSLLPLAACSQTVPGKGLRADDPRLAGKADVADRVEMKGDLSLTEVDGYLGARVEDAFTEDHELHGYTLLSGAGSTLQVGITQRGTSRGLDTTLYVYGPRGDSGYAERIAFDDDAGWGALSRIEALDVPAGGQYLVVVGTYSGIGRGSYGLQVECLSGDCNDVEAPAGCPEPLAEVIHDCVEDWWSEGDFEDSRNDGFVTCTTDYAGGHYDSMCDSSWHAPEDWCPGGFDLFQSEIMSACVDELEGYYPPDREPLELTPRSLPSEIEDRLAGSWSECCSVEAESYHVVPPAEGEATFAHVVDSVRQRTRFDTIPFTLSPESSREAVESAASRYDLGDDFLDLVVEDAGSGSFRVGHLEANWYPAAGAEAWADLYVLVFDDGVVTALAFTAGET